MRAVRARPCARCTPPPAMFLARRLYTIVRLLPSATPLELPPAVPLALLSPDRPGHRSPPSAPCPPTPRSGAPRCPCTHLRPPHAPQSKAGSRPAHPGLLTQRIRATAPSALPWTARSNGRHGAFAGGPSSLLRPFWRGPTFLSFLLLQRLRYNIVLHLCLLHSAQTLRVIKSRSGGM